VHDIADLESRGIPGVYVATVEFEQAGHGQAAALGATEAGVFVAHPVQDRSDEEMKEMARIAVDGLLERITG
jgi:hypothetical protein